MGIDEIRSPQDIKRLNIRDLNGIAESIRDRIISAVGECGGHLSSNLGAVELTIALHYVFNFPQDKIVFDVGHQSYTHKLLTGRAMGFKNLRHNGGVSGFPKPGESEYDAFTTGHASTSLSVALGLAEAALQKGEDRVTVALIGDGALTGGMAYEALNAIGSDQVPLVIVLNDNEMSISKNVGAMSNYLTRLRVSKKYAHVKNEIRRAVSMIPVLGDGMIHVIERGKRAVKRVVLSGKMFEEMGITYYGPFDGHDIGELIDVFSRVKTMRTPVLVHVLTDKGHGLPSAISDPAHSHGVNGSDSPDGAKAFSDVLGDFLVSAAEKDSSVMAVTAAMSIGTGLEKFAEAYPERFRDVGIAEEHAVTYSAALASSGMKPYFAVYSTFLQRGFDQLLHDVCIDGYPVTLCVDRAGAVGADGVTHQGVFDLSYLSMLPNMTVMCPTDGGEFKDMLEFSLTFDKPLAIRYPKSYTTERIHSPIEYGKWETVSSGKSKIFILCAGGRALDAAEEAAKTLDATVINCRFVKPLDDELLKAIGKKGSIIVTVEDNVRRGGFGESVLSFYNSVGLSPDVRILAHGDSFIDDMDIGSTLARSSLDAKGIVAAATKK